MAFFTLLAALLVQITWQSPWAIVVTGWFHRYADRLSHDLNAGRPAHGVVAWFAAVCPWALLALASFYLFDTISPALGWLWTLILLHACLGFRDVVNTLRAVFDALRVSDLERARVLLGAWREDAGTACYAEAEISKAAIETALVRAHRQVFGVIFWFVLLPGPTGAVLYRLSEELERRWAHRKEEEFRAFGAFAARCFYVLDWLPVRLSAVSFAVAGNFEDAISTWRTQAQSWIDRTQGIVLASGAGALGVRLGGPLPTGTGLDFRPELGEGNTADADYLQSTLSLLWRALIVWLVLFLLLTLARWAGH